jgi:hypothetical protein
MFDHVINNVTSPKVKIRGLGGVVFDVMIYEPIFQNFDTCNKG